MYKKGEVGMWVEQKQREELYKYLINQSSALKMPFYGEGEYCL